MEFCRVEGEADNEIKVLGIFDAVRTYHNGKEYFRYEHIAIYKLKNFETFLRMLGEGKIKVNFSIGVHRKWALFGQINYHGATFLIKRDALAELFELIVEE